MSSPVYLIPGVWQLQTKLNQLTSYIPPPPSSPDESTGKLRKILMIHAHPDPIKSFSAAIANQVESAAEEAGHEIRRISLYAPKERNGYRPQLSKQERALYYDTGEDLQQRNLAPEIKDHLRLLQWCDTLVFVYPTWWMNTPAVVKGFFDRTLVHDVAWSLPPPTSDGQGSTGLVSKLTNIQKIVGVSTYGAPYSIVTLAGDNGRRMIANAIRPIMSPQATVTWLGLYEMDTTTHEKRVDFLGQVDGLVKSL